VLEFIFEVIFEFFGEVLLQLAVSLLAEAGLHAVRNPDEVAAPRSPWLLACGYALLGLLAGGISLLVLPHSFMHTQATRIASLLLTPVAGGLALALLGAWRRRKGQATIELDRFGYGYVFALAMAAVRFYWSG
jgi:hypothetical protein